MIYRVVLTEQASDDLDATTDWWAAHRDREQAARWFSGIGDKLLTLREYPDRMPLADENEEFPYTLRELHYGVTSRPTHRAVFTIVGDKVLVLRVRHSAQDRITLDDVSEHIDDQ